MARRRKKSDDRQRRRADSQRGIPLTAPNAPQEGADAGDDDDLRHAYELGCVREYRSAANRHFANAKRLLCGARLASEVEARRAIDQIVRGFWWAEDSELEAQLHARMHEIGRWTRSQLGCNLEFDGDDYVLRCPIAIAHKKFGLSIGFTGPRRCSICGDDLSMCPHIRGRSYWVRGGGGDGRPCPVCMTDQCQHRPDRLYRASVVSVVTEMNGREVSWVPKPANPEARLLALPVSTTSLVETLGDEFHVGMPVSCDGCLGACWGFDHLDLTDPSPGPVGEVVSVDLTDDGQVDMTLRMPRSSAMSPGPKLS